MQIYGLRYSVLFLMLILTTYFSGLSTAQEATELISSTQQDAAEKKTIEPFSLKDHQGKLWSLGESQTPVVVIAFMGTECPLAKLYAPRLQKMATELGDKAQFVFIDSNQQDSLAELAHFVRKNELEIPFLRDTGNVVADQFSAERTPHVFVLDQKREIKYDGKIDDQYSYGVQRSKIGKNYLKLAIESVLDQTSVKISQTKPVGCVIGRVFTDNSSSEVTFANQISRILNKNCVNCHRAGQIGPFALTDYEEVVGWAGMIEEVVAENRMPPWHASASHGEFSNDARLSEEDKDLIKQWVENGAPLGDVTNLPAQPEFAEGWQIGTPDLIVKMANQPYKVRETGTVPYKYFVVDPGFKEDKWVTAAECRPGAREVVHHIIVGVRGQGEFNRERGVHNDLDSEWIAATAPGAPPLQLPEGYAKLIPAGSELIFQMHYTPNGTAQEDLSEIGLVFADAKDVKKRVYTQQVHNAGFEIPAGRANFEVQEKKGIPKDVELLTMFPHMHFRGKSFRFELQQPGSEFETLLHVPNYDFNWQNSYLLKNRMMIPAGSVMKCTAVFDNSEDNLANPDPSEPVRWGDQTDEEMMIGYFDVAIEIELKDDNE